MADDELISREEVLAGLPARRANTLLFLIESRTAQIVARSRVEFSLTEQATQERDMAFLEAFALPNPPPLHPTIQHLERYADNWASLVPSNPRLKAAIAHALSQKYTFTYQVVPNIRAALGLDEKAVQVAYSRLYRTQLVKIFTSKLPFIEQLRWTASAIAQKLESLPPFWLASLLTVALGLPQAFLALPIAVANIGPLPTVAFLMIIGIINIFTMVCMAEAIGRSGDFRYGNAFIKQLVSNYLGNIGSSILSLAVGIRVFLIALACYIGLSVTMANFTQISAALWAAVFFCVGLYLLLRKSLNFTVAVMLFLAAINVSILLILSLLAFRHVQLDNLLYINLPFLKGEAFQPLMLQQFLGVSLMLYFGHIYVGECAKLVLPRDPSASSLIWGTAVGTAVLTVLFCLWVIAVNGAISPQLLSGVSGTALDPLAMQVGPIAKVLGAALVTLLLGMAWLRSSSLLLNLAREWFPAQPQPLLMLPRQEGTVILHPRRHSTDVPYIGLSYLGMEVNEPKFCLDIQLGGNIYHVEIIVTQRWEIKELIPQFPELGKWDTSLTLEVRSANQDAACIRITSAMVLVYEGGLKADVSNAFPVQNSRISKLDIKTNTQQLWTNLLSQRRFLVSISPLVLVFLLTEWLCLAGTQSFSNILAFAGVLGNTIVGGIFPVLMLISSRRKGELVPGVVFQLLNHPVLIVGIYSLFLGILFVHGLFIWENPVARLSALGIALLSLLATLVMKGYGAFASRVVVELQEEQQLGGRSIFKITANGRSQIAEVCLGYAEGEQYHQASTVEIPSLESLRYAIFHLPTKREKELRVWAHRNNTNLDSKSLPALVEVESGDKKMLFDLKLSSGKVLLPLGGDDCLLKFTF
jgi:amino acid permease